MNMDTKCFGILKYFNKVTTKITVVLIFIAFNLMMFQRSGFDQSSIHFHHNKDLLLDAITDYKAFMCKETLPYSRHQFNISFIICFRDFIEDKRISFWFYTNGYAMQPNSLGTGKRYEEHLINVWLTLLDNYPDAVVLDLGSNIGVYTLASRAMGNKVISVDPNPHNHALLYNSLVLNMFNHEKSIAILNPISDGHYQFVGTDSTSDDSLDINNEKSIMNLTSITLFDLFGKNTNYSSDITINIDLDLIPDSENTVIIKIDIQGFECKALKKFLSLAKKPKFVPYIQMEIDLLCSGPKLTKMEIKEKGLSTFFFINGYVETALGKGTSLKYEEHIINIWLNLLKNYPNAVVLDIGSNIGVYTLASRAMGNKVIAVDPNPHNHALLFNSLVLNRYETGTIQIKNAISDSYYVFSGNRSLEIDPLDVQRYEESEVITTVTLFDIFELIPDDDTVIIKIDVEGIECKVLQKFLELTKKPKFVPYIQMEIFHFCPESILLTSPCKESFYTKFIPLLQSSGYTPHVPWPITYEELKKVCYFDALFVHKEAKAFPYPDKHLFEFSFQDNNHLL